MPQHALSPYRKARRVDSELTPRRAIDSWAVPRRPSSYPTTGSGQETAAPDIISHPYVSESDCGPYRGILGMAAVHVYMIYRHTFAVRTLVNWYRAGMDTDREMVKLSTYLGHTKPSHTYWYIEAVPELLELASLRVTHALAQEVVS